MEIPWLLIFKIKPGQLDAFKAVMHKLIAVTSKEPGMLAYEWSFSADGATCHIYERYTESAAIVAHAENAGPLIGELLGTCTTESFYVYGTPDEDAKAMIADLKPIYFSPVVGFSR